VGIGNQSQFPAEGRFWDGVLGEARVLRVGVPPAWEASMADLQTLQRAVKGLRVGWTRCGSPARSAWAWDTSARAACVPGR